MNDSREDPPDTLTDLADWYRYRPPDPREQMRREIGERQRRTVKRRRRTNPSKETER